MNNSILLVEDESELRDFLTSIFEENGYKTISVNDGKRAFEVLESFRPNLMILDHNLPDIQGSQVLSRLRGDAKYADLPVVFLTAISSEDNIVNAFDMGADDYIEKPFSVNVLLRRVKAVLNRYQEKTSASSISSRNILVKGDLEVDFDSYKVKILGNNLEITLMEFNILKELLKADGKPLSRESLIQRINGTNSVTERTIDVHICAIRKKLNTYGKTIETIRGVGYRLHV
ncbi:MAG: response regulator transcription factor [Bdellovibrionota bacterium]